MLQHPTPDILNKKDMASKTIPGPAKRPGVKKESETSFQRMSSPVIPKSWQPKSYNEFHSLLVGFR